MIGKKREWNGNGTEMERKWNENRTKWNENRTEIKQKVMGIE